MGTNESDNTEQAFFNPPGNLTAARLVSAFLVGLAFLALPQLIERGKQSGHTFLDYSMLWVVLLSAAFLLTFVELVVFILLWTPAQRRLSRWATWFYVQVSRLGKWNILGIIAPLVAYVFLFLYRYQKHFMDIMPQIWLFCLMAAVGAFFAMASGKKIAYFNAFLLVAVLYGAGVKVVGYRSEIDVIPFSLSWSEASRYYYASLPFSRQLYGQQFPLSFLHPSRYLLQSLAFLVPNAPIWFHRLWQVFLWVALSGLTGFTLARRFSIGKAKTMVITLWAALFLLQGPVYYHLTVCVLLVLCGFDSRRFWKSLVFVVLASLWAGISRVNWIPVPAMLAAALYLLERPLCQDVTRPNLAEMARYLRPVLLWGIVGGAAALASQGAYVLVSGQEDKSQFASSFTSSLLWNRLFPSATYPLGVLPSILIVSLPLLLLIGVTGWQSRTRIHWLRALGLAAILSVLFVGGLVVSAKIGGGSNIHNMDAFMAALLVIGTVIGLGHPVSDAALPMRVWRPWPLVAAIFLLPVVWNLNVGEPFFDRKSAQANYDLDKLNHIVQQYAPKGEILFITQRQLLTFNLIPGVRMIPDYELMTLTEMSMANNQAYFDRFDTDLRNHRFVLIIAARQQEWLKDPELDAFAEENNAWVENVSDRINRYYDEESFMDTQGIQLLVPKP